MVNLDDYLKGNSNVIVDLVNKKYVPAEMTKEPTFDSLAEMAAALITLLTSRMATTTNANVISRLLRFR
jgi:hypothetical protein